MSMGYTESFNEAIVQLDRIGAISASTQTNGAWVSVANCPRFVAKLNVGLIAATGTLGFQVRQAQDAAGLNAKAFKVMAPTYIDTDDNEDSWLDCRAEELDVDGGFDYVRIEVLAATAASLFSAELLGYVHRYGPATQPASLHLSP